MKGFTLIELMVAVSVGLVVTAMVVANYSAYNSTQALRQTALSLKNTLRFVQSNASSGRKPQSSVCPTLTGWGITFSLSGYSYQAYCNDVATGLPTSESFPVGITLTALPTVNPIMYYVVSNGTNIPSSVQLQMTGFDKQYRLSVSASGDITDSGIQ